MIFPQSIVVQGRRWRQRTYGNTYHTVSVIVDGEHIGTSPITYGYGDHYMQTAHEILVEKGVLPEPERYPSGARQPLWRQCQEMVIALHYDAIDVARKKDL